MNKLMKCLTIFVVMISCAALDAHGGGGGHGGGHGFGGRGYGWGGGGGWFGLPFVGLSIGDGYPGDYYDYDMPPRRDNYNYERNYRNEGYPENEYFGNAYLNG